MLHAIAQRYGKYERHLSAGALLAGFIVDTLTLTRVDSLFDNLILLFYLAVAGAGIVFINAYKAERIRSRASHALARIVPYAVQFSFGGLFSGFVVIYGRSASLYASWPFLLLLLVLLLGNEFFRRKYTRYGFQMTVFSLAVLSYLVLVIPVLFGAMGENIFLASVAAAFALAVLFARFVARISFPTVRIAGAYAGITAVFLVVLTLYFSRMIPPIPLSLKDAGVYHLVERSAGAYIAREERAPFFARVFSRGTLHVSEGGKVYFYSAVFAPVRLRTEIFHVWQRFDAEKEIWETTDKIPISVSGGREKGYRGYSFKSRISPGLWRVRVETSRGDLLGMDSFYVVRSEKAPETILREL